MPNQEPFEDAGYLRVPAGPEGHHNLSRWREPPDTFGHGNLGPQGRHTMTFQRCIDPPGLADLG